MGSRQHRRQRNKVETIYATEAQKISVFQLSPMLHRGSVIQCCRENIQS